MNLITPPIIGIIGIAFALFIYKLLMGYPGGEGKIKVIADKIHLGAMAFMRREYISLSLFFLILVILVWLALGIQTAIAAIAGALSSSIAGWMGMYSATKANVRTTMAAQQQGQEGALSVAFLGGSIMGLCVASLGLIGLGGLFWYFNGDSASVYALEGFGMGASCVALFSRVGGGIFTKSADIGADLVGKIEAGIPEDDYRNPGVIADNVGDNVGDIAGMGSDIFESYCGAMIASIVIASTMSNSKVTMILPLALASIGLLSSIIMILAIRAFSGSSPAKALRVGTIGAPIIFIAAAFGFIQYLDITINYWWCALCGAVGGIGIGLIIEYYTGGKPVSKIAQSAETGPATVMISGFALGMRSVVIPIIILSSIILISTQLAGLYGVGLAAIGMLATVGITMAIDAYGPIVDNAGGIAQMGEMGEEVRAITDTLDEQGNVTAAIGKGFAIGVASLSALAIIAAFVEVTKVQLILSDPKVLTGMLIGGAIPFLVASITITAVGQVAFEMINEIRRQFREIPGLLEGKAEPDTTRCIDIATKGALKRMLIPGTIAIAAPPVIGFTLGANALGGMLSGALLCCILLAFMMANSGGAWDNAKKFIEKGNYGGKGSEAHTSAVIGDTVGDPFKDTAGPSMNILINVMAIVSLVISPLLVELPLPH